LPHKWGVDEAVLLNKACAVAAVSKGLQWFASGWSYWRGKEEGD